MACVSLPLPSYLHLTRVRVHPPTCELAHGDALTAASTASPVHTVPITVTPTWHDGWMGSSSLRISFGARSVECARLVAMTSARQHFVTLPLFASSFAWPSDAKHGATVPARVCARVAYKFAHEQAMAMCTAGVVRTPPSPVCSPTLLLDDSDATSGSCVSTLVSEQVVHGWTVAEFMLHIPAVFSHHHVRAVGVQIQLNSVVAPSQELLLGLLELTL
ncbi:MAG: hypothetical protein EOO65_02380 [Methanosarcinales archaeon]|nr:MAG: hypothetical protein EOO65_02380 [Methanosarcinales archaeon]